MLSQKVLHHFSLLPDNVNIAETKDVIKSSIYAPEFEPSFTLPIDIAQNTYKLWNKEVTEKSLRIIYMGTPEFAVPALEKLVENGWNVVGVITAPDKPPLPEAMESAPLIISTDFSASISKPPRVERKKS